MFNVNVYTISFLTGKKRNNSAGEEIKNPLNIWRSVPFLGGLFNEYRRLLSECICSNKNPLVII